MITASVRCWHRVVRLVASVCFMVSLKCVETSGMSEMRSTDARFPRVVLSSFTLHLRGQARNSPCNCRSSTAKPVCANFERDRQAAFIASSRMLGLFGRRSLPLCSFRPSRSQEQLARRCRVWGPEQSFALRRVVRLAMQTNPDEDRVRLEQLFRSSEAAGTIPEEEKVRQNVTVLAFGDEEADPRILADNYVWKPDPRSQIMLPGLQQVLMVQEPHHCHMFETILAGPPPHRFVYLYSDDAAEDGDSKQLGVLAQVGACKRLPDNRLLLLAMGVARVAVTEQTSSALFERAVCEVLPDEEEVEQYLELGTGSVMGALRKTEHLSQDVLATVQDGYFSRASRIAAVAAAAAANLAWSQLELPGRPMVEGHKLDSIADIVDLNAAETAEAVSRRVAEAAGAAARAVAPRALREVGYRPMMHEADGRYEGDGLGDLGDAEGLPPSWMVVLDHYEERVDRETGRKRKQEEEEEEEEVETAVPAASKLRVISGDGEAVVTELERRVWVKLDEVMMLRAAVDSGGGGATRTLSKLPEQLRDLRPQRARHGWPTMRRAARLSFAMASLLKELGRVPEGRRHKLLGAQSIEERLEVILGAVEQSSAQLRAMLALRAASESQGERGPAPGEGESEDEDFDDG